MRKFGSRTSRLRSGVSGGFGLCAELFEILTLAQTEIVERTDVVLYGRRVLDPILNLAPLPNGARLPSRISICCIVRHPGGGVRASRDHLVAHHLEPATEQESTPGPRQKPRLFA